MTGNLNRADCGFVDAWLDDWLAGRVSDELARRIQNHVADCERCQRLTAIVREGESGGAAPDDSSDLAPAVLARTTGSPCARAESLLPSLVDGELDADSRDVLHAHVAHCEGCAKLLAALREAAQVLPGLAEIEPPPGFARRVLLATTAAMPLPAGSWWIRILARPRASLELAYVGAVLLVVLLGNPVAAFYQAEQRATEVAGAVPVARLSEQLGFADAAAGTIVRLLASVADTIQAEVTTRLSQARALMDAMNAAIRNAIAWIANLDVKQLLGAGGQAPPSRGQPPRTEPGARR